MRPQAVSAVWRAAGACRLIPIAVMALLLAQPGVLAADDILEQAIDYVFTGKIRPDNGPTIVDSKACIVELPDTRNKRLIRYYLGRFNMDTARIEKIYAGRAPSYLLEVEGDDNVVEFLNADKSVAHGHRTEQIPLPGDIDQTQRALKLIADRCQPEKAKPPF